MRLFGSLASLGLDRAIRVAIVVGVPRLCHQEPVAAHFLGAIHGAIGMPDQLLVLVAVLGKDGDADARGYLQALAGEFEGLVE